MSLEFQDKIDLLQKIHLEADKWRENPEGEDSGTELLGLYNEARLLGISKDAMEHAALPDNNLSLRVAS